MQLNSSYILFIITSLFLYSEVSLIYSENKFKIHIYIWLQSSKTNISVKKKQLQAEVL